MMSKELSEITDGVAVVGMALRFPGAVNAEEFWRNLLDGVESVSTFTDEELLGAGVPRAALRQPNYVRAKGVIEGEDLFDAPFFGFTPREAAVTDPQQRLFLECAWQALESAGYDPDNCRAAIGVFAGTAMSTYLFSLLTRRDIIETVGRYQLGIGNDKDHLPTMASYKLNLKGPSLNVQTSCSTSLVAVHLACQSLLGGECDMALAGGVTVKVPQKSGYFYQDGGITSPDGHCRAFDARAQGTVGGSGCGIVALKRLEDAVADGDTIHAVIRGSAVNNDGSAKVGYTAPSVGGQAAAVREAISIAGVDPGSIGYVEAHGTATPIGDPIEVRALSEAFGPDVPRGSCALGSVKTNVGHLDAAAGVAGLIKAVLAVREGIIPPTLHFERPNPALRLSETPFFVNAEPREWPRSGGPRRAGVSSFGIGGTNAHVVLEEPPPVAASESRRAFQVLTVSARTEKALERASAELAAHLRRHDDLSLSDVAYTLQIGRRAFKHRRALVCRELSEAADALESPSKGRSAAGASEEGGHRVAFMFPGQGAQCVNMGLGLYRSEESFRQQLDECAERLRAPLGVDLRELLYPRGATDAAARRLGETAFTQPALFAVEYATAQLFMSWGVRPSAMLGHSVGELVAACLAGVLSLEDALSLVAARGQLMQEMPTGAMLAVGLGEPETRSLLEERPLSLAAINGARQCVVSGEEQAIAALEEELSGRGAAHRRLQTSHAFHSPLMRPAAERFAELVARVSLKPPQTPYVSNITGRWVEPSEATSPAYWAEHLCAPVRFDDGLRLLCGSGNALLEVGPGRALCNLARELTARDENRPPVIETLGAARDPEGEARGVAEALGALWANGAKVSWPDLHAGERRRRVPLPTYPFERQRHWIEPLAPQAETPSHDSSQEESGVDVTQTHAPDAPRAQEAEAMFADTTNAAPTPRHERLLEGLKVIINELTGVDTTEVDPHATYFEMGVSSLLLIQATRAVEQRFGVKLALMQLFDELKTLDILAAYLDSRMPPEEPEPAVVTVRQATPNAPSSPAADVAQSQSLQASAAAPPFAMPAATQGTLEYVVAQQLSIMAQQLELLRGGRPALAPPVVPAESGAHANGAHGFGTHAHGANGNGENAPAPAKQEAARTEVYVPFQQTEIAPAGGLSDVQQRHLDDLIARYTQRTRRSKELTQRHRRVLADPRTTAGFRRLWKEMLYPLVVERSQGARLWDVDGNEYLDLTMGFGVHMFGHSPDFIREALAAQVERGIHLGPQSNLAGEVAALIKELTGVERVTFSNSGTEAVMAALRVARSVTGRSKVAFFVGSYHGTFDGILARSGVARGERRAVAMAPGVMPGMIEDVLVLDYGSEEALETIAKMKGELAAVLVEPVQSRRPDFQPAGYLRELRRLTEEGGAALIFDEVVTGFRVHPGGCQALFDVRADLVTYGKVIGGGLPIGVLAGSADYMDAIDGGYWQFGDDSYPAASKTFFSGTFCKHPLTMASAHAALKHMKEAGPSLQETLNRRATRLTTTLNDYFGREGLAFRVANFGSLLSFVPPRELKHAELFSYHLVEKGIYVWEGSTRYISTAHTDEDVDFIATAVRESVEELRAGGFMQDGAPKLMEGGRQSASTDLPAAHASGGNGAKPAGHASSIKASTAEPSGERAAAEEVPLTAPLTDAQKQLWLMAQLGADASRAYNESNTVRLHGSLDTRAMRKAMRSVFARHEALRTTFSADGEYQIVHPRLDIEVPLHDFSALAEPERERRLAEWVSGEAARSFDLTEEPLLRVDLIKLADEQHLLVLNFHHIVMDGWSSGLMLSDLRAFYEAECRGVECKLPPPLSFRDYAQREADEQGSAARLAADAYWLEQFATPPPALELPTDRPRPLFKTYNGAHEKTKFEASLCQDLKKLAARQGCTLLMVLLAGYEVLLHRLSGQDDIVVAVPAAGQVSLGEPNLFGHCVNLLLLRSRVAAGETFTEHLSAVRKTLLTGNEHQNFSFINLVKNHHSSRDASRSALFSAHFNFGQARSGKGSSFYGLDAEVLANETNSSKYDINLNIIEKNGELLVDFEYNTDLFDADTARRWVSYLRNIFRHVAVAPSDRVGVIPLTDEAERGRVVRELNRTASVYRSGLCLHELFEAQAAATPNRAAVACESERLTFVELNARANRLARFLRCQGIGPDSAVAILMERSCLLVVSLLAVLKAGAAYLPLDADHPPDRLSFMLRNAGARLLLAQRRLLPRAPLDVERVIHLDHGDGAHLSSEESDSDLAPAASPENLAYIIYTSGSTGAPKGVMIPHRGVVNYLEWCARAYPLAEGSGVPVHSPLGFDLTVTSLWAPLVVGQGVLMLPEGDGVAALGNLLGRERDLSLVKLTPTHLQMLARMLPAEEAAGRARALVVGGEALTGEAVRFWLEHAPDTRIINEYGPTETVVGCCTYEVGAGEYEAGAVPIGRPIANTEMYVLDERMEPAPVGVVGELYVGGAGVGRGYVGRAGQTAERFVPDLLSGRGGARLYRTGDIGRYRADGNLEYLGRRDEQVKVRGYRIELGEIESVLRQHEKVRDALALALSSEGGGEKRLAAYLLVRGERIEVAGQDWRDYLRQRLPDYMIPATFTLLDEFPLTPNGKVDRRALPPPEAAQPAPEASDAAPRTPEEETLVRIWTEMLPHERIGIHDNFFALGGDSIIGIQVVSKAQQAGLQLTPKLLFRHQTIAELAAMALPARGTESEQGIVTGPVSLTPIQHWFFEQDYPDPHHFNLSMLLEARGQLDPAFAERVLREWLTQHDALRLRFVRGPEGWRQSNAGIGPDVPFTRVDLSSLASPEERSSAIEARAAEAQASLNLSDGPLARVVFFDLGAQRPSRLLIVVHHLAVDGVSWRILLEDLQTAWQQLAAGEQVRLPQKTTSFQRWAERLGEYARSEQLRREKDYWLELSQAAPPRLRVDYAGGRNAKASARTIPVTLDAEETRALLQDVPARHGTEINDVLLTSLVLCLEPLTGSRSLLVDMEGHGREDILEGVDLSRTVGWFTSIFPVHLDITAAGDASEVIQGVKEQLRRIPNRGIGYGLLRYLGDDETARALRSLPAAEVSFNYLGQFDQMLPEAAQFAQAAEHPGPSRNPQGGRSHLLEVTGLVAGGQLRMNWTYSENIHRRETVEGLAQTFLGELRSLIALRQPVKASGFVPSNFADFDWDQSDFDSITGGISKATEEG